MAKKEKMPTLKEQMAKIVLAIVKLQQDMSFVKQNMATKKDFTELRQRLAYAEESKADKSDIAEVKREVTEVKREVTEVKRDIQVLNEHLTNLLQRYIEAHQKKHHEIEERLQKLETTST